MPKTNSERLQEIAEGMHELNGLVTVELGDFIANSDIDYWIYGHSHRNIDAEIGKTKVLSNQLGYIHQDEQLHNGFNSERYIVLNKNV